MKKIALLALVVTMAVFGSVARAMHAPDSHSSNTTQVGSVNLGGGLGDIAFWGDLAVVSRIQGFGVEDGATAGISVVDISTPSTPRELSRFMCTGGGWDVSVWEHLVFLSVDTFTATLDGSCSSPPRSAFDFVLPFQGLKVISIGDPARPLQVDSLPLPCGSHTSTIVPDLGNGRVLIYTSSLIHFADPMFSRELAECDSIIEVPLDDPSNARILGTLPMGLGRQCHDMTAHLARKLIAAACTDEFRLYDISDPAAPELLSAIVQPGVLQHSVAFSNDGNSLVTGEEGLFYDGEESAACHGGTGSPHGALWFYDITIPQVPVLRSYHQMQHGLEPASPGAAGCSAHYFHPAPTLGDRDILIAAWYAGGISAVDFTDLGAPTEIAYYQPNLNDPSRRAWYWSSYWYRGHVYASNGFQSQRKSLDVYAIEDPLIGETYRLPHLNPQSQESFPKEGNIRRDTGRLDLQRGDLP